MLHNEPVSEWIGREADLQRAWSELALRSFLLIGPRRIGKTELLKHLASSPEDGWRVLLVDVQAARTTADGLGRIRDALERAGMGVARVAEAVGRVESVQIAGTGASIRAEEIPDPWLAMGERLLRALDDLKPGARLVLALDEVPWWVGEVRASEGDAAARTALSGLRYLRQRGDLEARVRWILTGSVGLTGLARALNASADINDLHPQMQLGPLDDVSGRTLFELLITGRGMECDPVAAALACREAGGSPHWVRWVAGRAASQAVPAGAIPRVTLAAVQRALADIEHPRTGRDLFDDEGRVHLIKSHGRDNARVMAAILDAVAHSPDPIADHQIQAIAQERMTKPDRALARDLVFALVDAWYLDQGERGELRFVNPLFRRWWLRFGGDL